MGKERTPKKESLPLSVEEIKVLEQRLREIRAAKKKLDYEEAEIQRKISDDFDRRMRE